MLLAYAISIATGMAVAAFHYWKLIEDDPEGHTWLRNWVIRGLAAPALLWMLFNSGLLPGLPSFSDQLDLRHGFAWFLSYCAVSGLGIVVVSTYWGALTVLCMLFVIWSRLEDRRSFYTTAGVWTLLLLPVLLIVSWWGRVPGAGVLGMVWLIPIFYSTYEMVQIVKKKPTYSRAVTNMQWGKYEAAEAAVIEELEHNENDFEGWMMLAELYAAHFNDLAAADRTIRELCQEPSMSVSQISVALHRLADWYLQISKDPAAAKRVLEELCQKMPGTHLEHMARLRINQLPANKKEYLKQQEVKSVRLPRLDDKIDEAPAPGSLPVNFDSAKAQSAQLIEKLKTNPNDMESRVNLARIFAERLDQVDLAMEQLELLLGLPGIDPRQASQWLNMMAGWQIRIKHNENAAELILERIIRLNPQSPEAFTAQRRLNLMRREAKGRGTGGVAALDP